MPSAILLYFHLFLQQGCSLLGPFHWARLTFFLNEIIFQTYHGHWWLRHRGKLLRQVQLVCRGTKTRPVVGRVGLCKRILLALLCVGSWFLMSKSGCEHHKLCESSSDLLTPFFCTVRKGEPFLVVRKPKVWSVIVITSHYTWNWWHIITSHCTLYSNVHLAYSNLS